MLPQGAVVDGRFQVEAMVGEGGLAQVYRVRHRELGRVMALKLLAWRKQSLVERLVLEGRIQAQLRHPNIVAVVDLVRHDGQVGLLMEYIDGATSLHEFLHRQGALDCDEALELFAPVLSAVASAHRAGITHRDLKPANIMLARVGSGVVPKVTDFGIAKVVAEMASHTTRSGATMGTPGYLAPEQVRDASTIDGRADIFALGAILYELLVGRPAFADEHGEMTVTSTCTVEPARLDEVATVPASVADAVAKALSKDASDRFATCEAFGEALLAERPDLLSQLSAHVQQAVSLSVPPTSDSTGATSDGALASGVSGGALAGGTLEPHDLALHTARTVAVAPPPATTTEVDRRGWAVAALLGGALLLVLGVVGGGLAVASLQDDPVASAPVAPAAAVPPPVAPVVAPTPGPSPEPAADAVPESAPSPPVAPAPSPRRAARPAPAPAPAAAAVPAPDDAAEPEEVPVEVIEVPAAPVPAPAAPEPVAEEAPAPAPEAPASLPQLAGRWQGTAGRTPLTLQLADSQGGQVTGSLTIAVGQNVRREDLSGSLSADGTLQFRAADLVFEGAFSGGTLSGRYQRSGARKWLPWQAGR